MMMKCESKCGGLGHRVRYSAVTTVRMFSMACGRSDPISDIRYTEVTDEVPHPRHRNG